MTGADGYTSELGELGFICQTSKIMVHTSSSLAERESSPISEPRQNHAVSCGRRIEPQLFGGKPYTRLEGKVSNFMSPKKSPTRFQRLGKSNR